jgi:hypothetical protein
MHSLVFLNYNLMIIYLYLIFMANFILLLFLICKTHGDCCGMRLKSNKLLLLLLLLASSEIVWYLLS